MRFTKIVYSILILSFVVITHEFGHLVALQRFNVPVKEFSLGFGFGLPSLYSFHTSQIPGVEFKINMLPLGGYVEPTEEGVEMIKTLPLKQQALISGAGVWINLIIGVSIILILFFIKDKKITTRRVGMIILILCLCMWPTYFSLIVIPCGGLVFLGFVIRSRKKVSGPINMIKKTSERINTFQEATFMMAGLSVGIGLMNMIPLLPFDGGKIMAMYVHVLSPKLDKVYTKGSFLFSMTMLYTIMVLELWSIMPYRNQKK